MTATPITVSDHALLRYIERVYGVDVDKLREEIADIVRPAVALKATARSVGDRTYVIVYRDGAAIVTTVLPTASRTSSAQQKRIADNRPEGRMRADSHREAEKRGRRMHRAERSRPAT